MNGRLIAPSASGNITLKVPPQSTVFISDLVNAFYRFANKSLVIERAGKTDSINSDYPYRNLPGFRRKPDPAYHYFDRTILWYDIR